MAKTTKRDAILVAALEELSRRGFHGARIERIAAAAGANKQLIFHYFGSKDGLYVAAVSHTLSTAPRLPPDAPPPEALRRYASLVQAWSSANPWTPIVLAECLSGIELPAAAVAATRTWVWETATTLRSILDDGQRKGHFRDDLEHRAVMEAIIGVVVGDSLLSRGGAEATPSESRAATVLGTALADYCGWR